MTRKSSRILHAIPALLLIGLSGSGMAQEPAAASITSRASLLPERWCIETHMATPSLAVLLEPRPVSDRPWSMFEFAADNYRLRESFADRSDLSYRLAELDTSRLVTFWKGESLGVFLGISTGGFISLSVAQ